MEETKFYYKNNLAPKPNKPNHLGACAIIIFNNKILFERRIDSNRWALIGGGLRIDESLEQCIIREICEETGLIVQEQSLIFFNLYSDPTRIIEYPDGNIFRTITCAYLIQLDKLPNLCCSSESLELSFFCENEIKKLKIAETHEHIISDFFEKIFKRALHNE